MSFDWLAPHYRWMEALLAGSVLQRARTRWLDALGGRHRLLIVGEGPGRTLEVICRRFPELPVTVVEASAGMIAAAKRRLFRKRIACGQVRWIQADVRRWLAERRGTPSLGSEGGFDAVITSFVIDCFSPQDVSAVVAGIARAMSGDAVWLLADFRVPEKGWRRWRGAATHRLMYWFFRTTTQLEARRLTPPDGALSAAGFRLEERALFNAGLVHSDLWRRGR